MTKELRRSLAVLPMSTVVLLTDLTPRQIRYYEKMELITPERTQGKQRRYSLNHVDKLLEIKDLLSAGYKMDEIYVTFYPVDKSVKSKERLKKEEIRFLLREEIARESGL